MQEHLELAEHELKKIVKVNFMAALFLLKAVSLRMRDSKKGGSIIFLTTLIGAERGLYPGAAANASSLAGVQQLVRVREHVPAAFCITNHILPSIHTMRACNCLFYSNSFVFINAYTHI